MQWFVRIIERFCWIYVCYMQCVCVFFCLFLWNVCEHLPSFFMLFHNFHSHLATEIRSWAFAKFNSSPVLLLLLQWPFLANTQFCQCTFQSKWEPKTTNCTTYFLFSFSSIVSIWYVIFAVRVFFFVGCSFAGVSIWYVDGIPIFRWQIHTGTNVHSWIYCFGVWSAHGFTQHNTGL